MLLGQVFFKPVLEIEGYTEKNLRSAENIGYILHGKGSLFLFMTSSQLHHTVCMIPYLFLRNPGNSDV